MALPSVKPRSWLFDLFGDYVEHRERELWTGNIIALAAEFDLTERAIRSALMRLQRDGWIDVRRAGTRSWYGLTDGGRELIDRGRERIMRGPEHDWDERWVVLTYTIPESRRDLRDRLRAELGPAMHPLHYLAIPPALFGEVIRLLGASRCADGARVILEKPFGRDLASAEALKGALDAAHSYGFATIEVNDSLALLTEQTGSADEAMKRISVAENLARLNESIAEAAVQAGLAAARPGATCHEVDAAARGVINRPLGHLGATLGPLQEPSTGPKCLTGALQLAK